MDGLRSIQNAKMPTIMSIAVVLALIILTLQAPVQGLQSLHTSNTTIEKGEGGSSGGLSMSLYNPFSGLPLPDTIEVKIKNQLQSKASLAMYCKDETKVGMQEIGYDSTYAFSFTQPLSAVVFKNTVTTCEFKWNNEMHKFDIYKQKRDSTNCKTQCDWEIKEKGPCLVHSSCYSWS